MAIRKRLADDLRVVCVTADDAIDWTKTPQAQYVRTRDPALVQERPGARVTWWTLRPLHPAIVASCQSLRSPEAEQEAFRFGCRSCSDSSLGVAWDGAGDDRRVTIDSLKLLPDTVWQELGLLVLHLGRLSAGEPPRFALPPGSRVMPTPLESTTAPYAVGSD
jgi:hypothetical protein